MKGLQSADFYETKNECPWGWRSGKRTFYHVRIWYEPGFDPWKMKREMNRTKVVALVAVATDRGKDRATSLALSGYAWGETKPWRYSYDVEEIGETRYSECVIDVIRGKDVHSEDAAA